MKNENNNQKPQQNTKQENVSKYTQKDLNEIYSKYRYGFVFNILSVVVYALFVALFIVELAQNNLSVTYIILGAVFGILLGVFSIYTFVRNIIKIKKLKNQLNNLKNGQN